MTFPSVSIEEARTLGIHVRATELTELSFIITHRIRRILGNSELKAEIVAAPTTKSTRLNITQYSFNPQSNVAIIRGLTRGVVYNVRFFMITGATFSGRKYFVNTLIKQVGLNYNGILQFF